MKTIVLIAGLISTLFMGGANPAPHIKEPDFSFDSLEINRVVHHNFILENPGRDTLHVVKISASCGCTVGRVDDSVIAPNSSTTIRIQFDASHKAPGQFTKTVTVLVEPRPSLRDTLLCYIRGTLIPAKPGHMEAMHLDGIFQGKCAECHAERGHGLMGVQLFMADCAVCHGTKDELKPAPYVGDQAMIRHDSLELTRMVSHGIAGTNMPAFHTRNGGPLSDSEIASVVGYIGTVGRFIRHTSQLQNVRNFNGQESPGH